MTRTSQKKNTKTNKKTPETSESKDTKKPKLINPSLGERDRECIPPGSAPGGQDPSRLRRGEAGRTLVPAWAGITEPRGAPPQKASALALGFSPTATQKARRKVAW